MNQTHHKIACLFPGQGSQSVGMGKDLYENFDQARAAFDQIDTIAGRAISRLCFNGPDEELKRTINTQPAILAVSLAAWRCYQALSGPAPDFLAGHSLGEFSALVAGGALTLPAAVRLVGKRAELMESCPAGAMSAVLGLAPDALDACCAKASASTKNIVIVANYNTPAQLVISGDPQAVACAGDLARQDGGKVISLPVGGAFHSPLMAQAADSFKQELALCELAGSAVPVVQNYDACPATVAARLKEKLSRQMPSPVRWLETIKFMLGQSVDTFIEIGPGKALTGMVKKIERNARTFNIFDAASLTETLSALSGAASAK